MPWRDGEYVWISPDGEIEIKQSDFTNHNTAVMKPSYYDEDRQFDKRLANYPSPHVNP